MTLAIEIEPVVDASVSLSPWTISILRNHEKKIGEILLKTLQENRECVLTGENILDVTRLTNVILNALLCPDIDIIGDDEYVANCQLAGITPEPDCSDREKRVVALAANDYLFEEDPLECAYCYLAAEDFLERQARTSSE